MRIFCTVFWSAADLIEVRISLVEFGEIWGGFNKF